MTDFCMMKLTAASGSPLWVNMHQICAVKPDTDPDATDSATEVHIPGRAFRCTETVDEVMQLIKEALSA